MEGIKGGADTVVSVPRETVAVAAVATVAFELGSKAPGWLAIGGCKVGALADCGGGGAGDGAATRRRAASEEEDGGIIGAGTIGGAGANGRGVAVERFSLAGG